MSGGHWDYVALRIADGLEAIAEDNAVARWPLVRAVFNALAEWIPPVERAMDYDLSGDSYIEDDVRFDHEAFGRLLVAVLKIAPDELFPRGKWATIQAVQQRQERER